MSIVKEPFRNYRIGEPDPLREGRVFTVRLNAEEYKQLLTAMSILHISSDSTCFKQLAWIGKNVAFTLISPETWRWLTDGNRRVNESKLDKLSSKLD